MVQIFCTFLIICCMHILKHFGSTHRVCNGPTGTPQTLPMYALLGFSWGRKTKAYKYTDAGSGAKYTQLFSVVTSLSTPKERNAFRLVFQEEAGKSLFESLMMWYLEQLDYTVKWMLSYAGTNMVPWPFVLVCCYHCALMLLSWPMGISPQAK